MVAHDLASPLQTMLGYAGLLNGDASLTHHQRDLAARIIGAGREMLVLVDDLGQGLVVDVDTPRERALVDIDDLVDSVLTHHQVAAAHRDVSVRHIRIPAGRSSGRVQGDVTQLERVLDRLVSNALRVTPDGGLILVSVTVDADAVAIEVADEGPGLDAMRISELFSPMQDTHGSSHNPGIAMGLSVCRRIAEQHGGLARRDLRARERRHLHPGAAGGDRRVAVGRPPERPTGAAGRDAVTAQPPHALDGHPTGAVPDRGARRAAGRGAQGLTVPTAVRRPCPLGRARL